MQTNIGSKLIIGVFNNLSFITTKKSFYATETNSVRKMSLLFLTNNMVVLFFSFSSCLQFLFTKTIETRDSSQLYRKYPNLVRTLI